VAREERQNRPTVPGHRFKRRELDLAEGGKLVLHTDGSIDQVDGMGTVVQTWGVDAPEWARHAIRFGLLPQPDTTVPPDARVRAPKTVV
jgi:hypothetical protein